MDVKTIMENINRKFHVNLIYVNRKWKKKIMDNINRKFNVILIDGNRKFLSDFYRHVNKREQLRFILETTWRKSFASIFSSSRTSY